MVLSAAGAGGSYSPARCPPPPPHTGGMFARCAPGGILLISSPRAPQYSVAWHGNARHAIQTSVTAWGGPDGASSKNTGVEGRQAVGQSASLCFCLQSRSHKANPIGVSPIYATVERHGEPA